MKGSKVISIVVVLAVFIGAGAAIVVFNPAGIVSPARKAVEDAENTKTIEAWQVVVDQFAGTNYAERAQKEIFTLELQAAWKQASQENNLTSYLEFLNKYPETAQAKEANKAIRVIREAQWQTTSEKDSIQGYRKFLAAGPDDEWASAGQKRIDELLAEHGLKSDPEFYVLSLDTGEPISGEYDRFIVTSDDGENLYVADKAPFYEYPRPLFGSPSMGMLLSYGNEWLLRGEKVPIKNRIFKSDPEYPLLFKATEKGLVYVGGRGSVAGPNNSVRVFGANHTVDRFLVQIRSTHPSEVHTAVYGLANLAKSPEAKQKAAAAISESLGKASAYPDVCRAEALYLLAQPVSLKPLQEYLATLRSQSVKDDSTVMPLAKAVVNAHPLVYSPDIKFGDGKVPWYTKYYTAALTQVAQATPPYSWPPEDAETLNPGDPQFRRIYVPLFFANGIDIKGSLSILEKEGSVYLKTERPGDSMPMQIGRMMGGGGSQIPIGIGSEIRFGGSLNMGDLRLVVSEGRLAFRKTYLGWVFFYGKGAIEYGDGKTYTFGNGRDLKSCMANFTNSDDLLREAAVIELSRFTIPEEGRPEVIAGLTKLIDDPSTSVSTAAKETIGFLQGEKTE